MAAERLPDMKTEMLKYAREHVEEIGEGLEVLPGVASLLDALSSSNVVIGLVGLLTCCINLHIVDV